MGRISEIEIMELGEGKREASSPWSSTILVLRLITSDGMVGYGEAPTTFMTMSVMAQMKEASRIFKGKDPESINANMMELYKDSFYMPVSVEATAAASAFEIASWDIVGKMHGMPIYTMLGGKLRDKARAYANGWYSDCVAPEQFARKARKMRSKGFTALKFDPFRKAYDTINRKRIEEAYKIVKAVKGASKDMEVMIEFHGRFDANSGILAAKELESLEPLFMEEPVHPDQFEGLLRLRKAVSAPIALGERVLDKNLFMRYFTSNAVDVIQPDLTNFGGIMEAFKVAAMADSFGIEVAFHNAFGPIQSAATVNVDLAIRNFLIQESFEAAWPEWKRKLVSGYSVDDGYFKLSGKPGLGITVNERMLDEYKVSGMEPFSEKEPPWVVEGTFRNEKRRRKKR
ncbi:mandelate racemase/muconate lactonizing enzyme family protein [Candidatus Marsarchaeota archaeon]|nr:mandelate racemase/muconate lactonizing enzyme family protein [Candidatus Marsarchaeota archaeon]